MTSVLVVNGPHLGRLGLRDPQVYGATTHAELTALIARWASDYGLSARVVQSDSEVEIMHALHEAVDAGTHVVLNAAAYTHYSRAIAEGVAQVTAAGLCLIEVHLSNVYAREQWRHTSVIAPVATGVICGLGIQSYHAALLAIAQLTASRSSA